MKFLGRIRAWYILVGLRRKGSVRRVAWGRYELTKKGLAEAEALIIQHGLPPADSFRNPSKD